MNAHDFMMLRSKFDLLERQGLAITLDPRGGEMRSQVKLTKGAKFVGFEPEAILNFKAGSFEEAVAWASGFLYAYQAKELIEAAHAEK